MTDRTSKPKSTADEALACFEAAFADGWLEALADGNLDRIRDIWARRIMFAHEALSSSGETPCVGWQPIAGAQRDETNVWVACTEAMRPAFWSKVDGKWVDAIDGSDLGQRFTPTHWQPLPQLPPKTGADPHGS